ncbi:MAG: hypothetical protein Q8P44_04630, partial [Dehalococcoidia bacterium]|nr:hypothetical protein [Dehalococcoidia bacterium]
KKTHQVNPSSYMSSSMYLHFFLPTQFEKEPCFVRAGLKPALTVVAIPFDRLGVTGRGTACRAPTKNLA